ncbi:MAG: DUF2155 domain-containing protein [Rhodobacteraceae bacterium]|nr:DUF2155 domain-containing protein [Paracoccaceae bacterium]
MRLAAFAAALGLLACPATAQQGDLEVAAGTGAILRALDTLTGHLEDLTVLNGTTITFKRLEITMKECRYPVENPFGDAFAHLVIRDIREDSPRFSGWMVASSPALSAMDHPRYDVWVLRCSIPPGVDTSGN